MAGAFLPIDPIDRPAKRLKIGVGIRFSKWSTIVVEPVSLQDTNRKSLQLWAAYATRTKAALESGAERVTLEAAPEKATLEAVPEKATLEAGGSHAPGCRCALCSSRLGTTPAPIGGKIVKVNLSGELTEEEKRMVRELAERDAEVRRHEQAHLMTAGPYALGGPHYTYQVGPDGKRYAVGGEVQVDMSEVEGNPEETLRKAMRLQQAALAPADPSAADRQVAMRAATMAQEARQEIAEERMEKMQRKAEGKQKDGAKESKDVRDQEESQEVNESRAENEDSEIRATNDIADDVQAPETVLHQPTPPSKVDNSVATAALSKDITPTETASMESKQTQDFSLDLYA